MNVKPGGRFTLVDSDYLVLPPIFVVNWLVLEWSPDQQDYLWRCSEVIPQSMVVPNHKPWAWSWENSSRSSSLRRETCSESESSSIASHCPNDFSSGSHLWKSLIRWSYLHSSIWVQKLIFLTWWWWRSRDNIQSFHGSVANQWLICPRVGWWF